MPVSLLWRLTASLTTSPFLPRLAYPPTLYSAFLLFSSSHRSPVSLSLSLAWLSSMGHSNHSLSPSTIWAPSHSLARSTATSFLIFARAQTLEPTPEELAEAEAGATEGGFSVPPKAVVIKTTSRQVCAPAFGCILQFADSRRWCCTGLSFTSKNRWATARVGSQSYSGAHYLSLHLFGSRVASLIIPSAGSKRCYKPWRFEGFNYSSCLAQALISVRA